MIAGIDIGSRSIELVCLEEGHITCTRRLPTTFDPRSQLLKIIEGLELKAVAATGYGRTLAGQVFLENEGRDIDTLTEIKAYGLGVSNLVPGARTVVDIGGQDTKAIALSESGRVIKFEMNDRCAAGTGKFLEHVANIFQIEIDAFGQYALQGNKELTINSMCTVFAETEATSLMAQGHSPYDIALGLHASIVKRTLNMIRRVGLNTPLVFAGGVANNPCIVNLLGNALGEQPIVPENPDSVGAYGAAMYAHMKNGGE